MKHYYPEFYKNFKCIAADCPDSCCKDWDVLLTDAKQNPILKQELLNTRESENPVENFCNLCQQKGYNITIGELFTVGQAANGAKLRSVNGGGVNGIDGWDDAYEQFFLSLIWCK